MWDSSPFRLPGWFTLLLKDITNENSAFDSLLKYRYVATSRGVACVSAGHAAALEDSLYGPYTYQDPAPLDPRTEATVMAKVASGCMFHADKLDADSAARAAAPAAPAPASAPAATVPVVHVINRRFKEAPEEIDSVDLELCQFILRRIGNVTVRDAYAAKAKGSGRTLINLLSTKKDTCLSAKAAYSRAI